MTDNSRKKTKSTSQNKRVILSIGTALVATVIVFVATQPQSTGGPQESVAKIESEPRKIRQISILGERNSGTRWTWGHLSECFNHTVPVVKTFTRYKHWFQYPDYTRYPHDTLVIAQFRNPYDWIKAMQRVPHHAPSHFRVQNDWYEFVTLPWTMDRVGTDLQKKGDETCQEHFPYRDIISCDVSPLPKSAYNGTLHYSEDKPFYEMRNDGSGEPYANILEMRSAKIRNFLEVKDYSGVADAWVVQYEYLLAKGTQYLLDQIQEWTGIEPKCSAYPPQQRRSRPLSKDFVEHITQNLDWKVERLVGYAPQKRLEDPILEG